MVAFSNSSSQNSGQSTSSSTSSPVSIQSPQSDFALSLAGLLANLGNTQYQWGMDQYANTSAVTDANINNYLTLAQQATNLAGNNIDRYTNLFQPEENQLVQDANTYASAPRIARDMGAAESTAGQAGDAARVAAEQNLKSYGIDPSSGRYAELEQAQRTATGASQAAAGNEAELADEQIGRQLRSEAIQVGQQYPGQVVNELNNAMQGVAGAENSALGNANTGVNLLDSASPFYNEAMSLRYPPVGQNSVSGSQSTQQGTSGSSSFNSGAPSGARSQGSPSRGESYNPNTTPAFTPGPSTAGGPGGAYDPTGMGTATVPQNLGGLGSMAKVIGINGPDGPQGPEEPPPPPGGVIDSGFTNPFIGQFTSWQGSQDNPFTDTTGAGGYNPGDFSTVNPWNSENMNPGAAAGGFTDPNAGQNFQDLTNWENSQPSITDFTGAGTDWSSGGTGYGDVGNANVDTSGGWGDYSTPDTSGFTDYSGDSGGDSGYAQGGAIPDPTSGGQVPTSASPSMGQNTDDVPARLNAGEFVIPRDVAAWKGHEFFQKLIDQSRKARTGASAQPTRKPALPMKPSFISKRMTPMGAQHG